MQLDLARPAKDTETKPANRLIKSVRASGESAIGTASHFRSRFDEQSATRGRPTLCLAAARSRVPSPRGSVRKGKSFEGQLPESQLNPLFEGVRLGTPKSIRGGHGHVMKCYVDRSW